MNGSRPARRARRSSAGASRPTLLMRRRTLLDPRAGHRRPHDLLVRDGRDRRDRARPARSSRPTDVEVDRRRGPARVSRASSTRTCTCARPAARTRRTSSPARAPPRRAASAACSRCRTPTRSSTTPRCCARFSERAGIEARRAGRLPGRDHAGARRARELTEMAELAREGAAGFSDDGVPVADARACCGRRSSTSACAGGVLALHEEDPLALGRRRDARGRDLDAARASPGSRRSPRAR